MVLYKHQIVVFGGFYDTLREVRYFNDLHVFDLDTFKWQEIKPRLGCIWPSARSGFQFFVFQDEICGLLIQELGNGIRCLYFEFLLISPSISVKKSGMPSGPCARFTIAVHKKRALLFGGVVDMEVEAGDVMMSLFLNELYGFQMDSHRWYPLELRKEKSTKDNKKLDQQLSGSSLEKRKADESVDNDEDAPDFGNSNDEISESFTKKISVYDAVVKPCGRIISCMVVGRDTLYVYGGMMEIKDQEITLDDLYSLNLSKLDEWKCIIPMNDGGKALETEEAVAILKGEKKKLRRKEKRARIDQIRANLGLSDSQRTPVELHKDGFDLAESRYKELKPILDELAILEAEQKAEEAEGAETSSGKRNNKKKNKAPQR
ncbi:hypothetical protein MKX01_022024 [Papaver californicum]|nr:hypothetical protein MKX01_022024 [Papaver californicum]